MNQRKFTLLSLLSLAGAAMGQEALACGFGTKPFACCSSSPFAGAGETRILSGCALSRADAWARCAATAADNIQLRWDTTQCQGGSARPNPGTQGHACTVANRGGDSYTYFQYDNAMSVSREGICQRARQSVPAGSAPITHTWYTTYYSNTNHKAVAECQNGTWTAYGQGVQSILNVNQARKQGGGKGCLFKVIKD